MSHGNGYNYHCGRGPWLRVLVCALAAVAFWSGLSAQHELVSTLSRMGSSGAVSWDLDIELLWEEEEGDTGWTISIEGTFEDSGSNGDYSELGQWYTVGGGGAYVALVLGDGPVNVFGGLYIGTPEQYIGIKDGEGVYAMFARLLWNGSQWTLDPWPYVPPIVDGVTLQGENGSSRSEWWVLYGVDATTGELREIDRRLVAPGSSMSWSISREEFCERGFNGAQVWVLYDGMIGDAKASYSWDCEAPEDPPDDTPPDPEDPPEVGTPSTGGGGVVVGGGGTGSGTPGNVPSTGTGTPANVSVVNMPDTWNSPWVGGELGDAPEIEDTASGPVIEGVAGVRDALSDFTPPFPEWDLSGPDYTLPTATFTFAGHDIVLGVPTLEAYADEISLLRSLLGVLVMVGVSRRCVELVRGAFA